MSQKWSLTLPLILLASIAAGAADDFTLNRLDCSFVMTALAHQSPKSADVINQELESLNHRFQELKPNYWESPEQLRSDLQFTATVATISEQIKKHEKRRIEYEEAAMKHIEGYASGIEFVANMTLGRAAWKAARKEDEAVFLLSYYFKNIQSMSKSFSLYKGYYYFGSPEEIAARNLKASQEIDRTQREDDLYDESFETLLKLKFIEKGFAALKLREGSAKELSAKREIARLRVKLAAQLAARDMRTQHLYSSMFWANYGTKDYKEQMEHMSRSLTPVIERDLKNLFALKKEYKTLLAVEIKPTFWERIRNLSDAPTETVYSLAEKMGFNGAAIAKNVEAVRNDIDNYLETGSVGDLIKDLGEMDLYKKRGNLETVISQKPALVERYRIGMGFDMISGQDTTILQRIRRDGGPAIRQDPKKNEIWMNLWRGYFQYLAEEGYVFVPNTSCEGLLFLESDKPNTVTVFGSTNKYESPEAMIRASTQINVNISNIKILETKDVELVSHYWLRFSADVSLP